MRVSEGGRVIEISIDVSGETVHAKTPNPAPVEDGTEGDDTTEGKSKKKLTEFV